MSGQHSNSLSPDISPLHKSVSLSDDELLSFLNSVGISRLRSFFPKYFTVENLKSLTVDKLKKDHKITNERDLDLLLNSLTKLQIVQEDACTVSSPVGIYSKGSLKKSDKKV